MSVDINWDAITGGAERGDLANAVRDFVHERFQQIPLPRFIHAVKVHSFDFGSVAPDITIKDICDPLPDFYEIDESDDSSIDGDARHDDGLDEAAPRNASSTLTGEQSRRVGAPRDRASENQSANATGRKVRAPTLDPRLSNLTLHREGPGPPSAYGATTPGIPGGTSNLSYFHLPLSAGLSGTNTPLAAVAGAQLGGARLDRSLTTPLDSMYDSHHRHTSSQHSITPPSSANSNSRPPSQQQHDQNGVNSEASKGSVPLDEASGVASPRRVREQSPEDIQVVTHMTYAGDITMSLTTEILVDYPMPSFVGIPLKLNLTGVSFDGVALLAYIRKRAHFCFLAPDDADALVGRDTALDGTSPGTGQDGLPSTTPRGKIGGLFEEIKIESEIGQKENGKQVLKNVGKVEKFILEQVRNIFEDELVYPSFWTFLV